MKRLLAVDTSTWWGSVALVECDQAGSAATVAERGGRKEDSHAEGLIDRIAELLAAAGWPKGSIDLYVATRGPGSFTGIRIALGTVRGLSLAAGRPAVGVTTLSAIAEASGPGDRERLVVMEAGRGELYAARYDACSSPPRVVDPPWVDAAAQVLETAGAALILPGPGTTVDPPAGATLLPAPERLAAAAGRIAASSDETEGLLAPLYIRPPDALLKRSRG